MFWMEKFKDLYLAGKGLAKFLIQDLRIETDNFSIVQALSLSAMGAVSLFRRLDNSSKLEYPIGSATSSVLVKASSHQLPSVGFEMSILGKGYNLNRFLP